MVKDLGLVARGSKRILNFEVLHYGMMKILPALGLVPIYRGGWDV